MKHFAIACLLFFASLSYSFSQCSAEVNENLTANYDYILSVINTTGTAPFTYSWSVTDGNGIPVPFIQTAAGDTVIIESYILMQNYGCIIYHLCLSDAVGCTTCVDATSVLDVPYECFSQFTSEIIAPGQISVTLISGIPPVLIMDQTITWENGNGEVQFMPYLGPGTIINYTSGSENTSNTFLCCIISSLVNGGCLFCDNIPYTDSEMSVPKISDSQASFFPNPATNTVLIRNTSSITEVQVFELTGAQVVLDYTLSSDSARLDVNNLPTGIYLVRVLSNEGISTMRLIKN